MRRKTMWFIVMLAIVWSASSAMAGWEEDQAEMFNQIAVKPGDKIDTTNWQQVKDIIPECMVEWVKRGDFVLNIVELKWDYNTDKEWRQASANNKGKYSIDPETWVIIDNATGKVPDYVYGEPFPEIDWKNDPQAGKKLIDNQTLKTARLGDLALDFHVDWVGRDGWERNYGGVWYTQFFWSRPDNKRLSNPEGILNYEMITVDLPYDLKGINTLTQRYIDQRADQMWSFVPAIRRVKRLSAAERSSPTMGSDFVNDDANGWYGKNESQDWKILDKQIILMPFDKWNVDGPVKHERRPDGSWHPPAGLNGTRWGHDDPDNWKGAPWAPLDLVYAPRMMYVVEAISKDPYYNYGTTIHYLDPVAGYIYKVIHNKAGEYWKMNTCTWIAAEWDNKITISSESSQLIVDDKLDHACTTTQYGPRDGRNLKVIYMTSEITPSLFTPTTLTTMGK